MSDKTASSDDRAESVSRQLEGSEPGVAGQTASPATEAPVSADEMSGDAPDSPKGVGESQNRSGEDIRDADGKEPGRHDEAADSPTGRPAGTSDARDATGVNPTEHADAPTLGSDKDT